MPTEPPALVSAPAGRGPRHALKQVWRLIRRELYAALSEPVPAPGPTLDALRADADALVRFARSRSNQPVQCRGPGCSACCRGIVPISVREAVDIAASLTFGQAQAVRAARVGVKTWASRCPLLTPEGACGVYERRPVACRLHLSMDDPARCEGEGPSRANQPRVQQGEVLLGLLVADGVGDLVPMLAAELERPGLGAEAFTRAHGEARPARVKPVGLMGTVV